MSMMELLYAQAAERPDHVALVYGDERIAYADLVERIERLADGLAQRGIGAGDAVGLALRDDPWLVTSFHAITALGAVVVPVNPAFKQTELEFNFRATGVAADFLFHVESTLRDRGYSKIWGYVVSDNRPARWVYSTRGYKPMWIVRVRRIVSIQRSTREPL